MQKHWYAIHTFSGHENKVMTNILRQAEARKLSSKISDIRVPIDEENRTRAGKRQVVKLKRVPGYVFIQMVLDDETWHLIRSISGVLGFVSSGSKPSPLNDDQVQSFLQTDEDKPQRPKVLWSKADVIRVTSGPFSGLTGKIEDVLADKEKLRALISIFGRETPVELDFIQVEKG